MTDSKKLLAYLDSSSMTIDMLAGKMGLDRRTLERKVAGITEFKTEEIELICACLTIPKDRRSRVFFKDDAK